MTTSAGVSEGEVLVGGRVAGRGWGWWGLAGIAGGEGQDFGPHPPGDGVGNRGGRVGTASGTVPRGRRHVPTGSPGGWGRESRRGMGGIEGGPQGPQGPQGDEPCAVTIGKAIASSENAASLLGPSLLAQPRLTSRAEAAR